MTKMSQRMSYFFCALGFFASLYSLYHFIEFQRVGYTSFSCNINRLVNCDFVAQSVYSSFLGIPLGVWGSGYFLCALLLLVFSKRDSLLKPSLQIYTSFLGVAFLCMWALIYISIFYIKHVCLTCVVVYVSIIGQIICLFLGKKNRFFIRNFSWSGSLKVLLIPVFSFLISFSFYFYLDSKVDYFSDIIAANKNNSNLSKDFFQIPIVYSPYAGSGQDYFMGSKNSPVTIVEFVDFECPACRAASEGLIKIKKEFKDKVLVVLKNYPLDQQCNPYIPNPFHKHSCELAMLARCAGRSGLFWKFHDLAFAAQGKNQDPTKLALSVGLGKEEVSLCLKDANILKKIKEDIEVAKVLGIQGTPTIYVNGRKFEGRREMLKFEVARLLNL